MSMKYLNELHEIESNWDIRRIKVNGFNAWVLLKDKIYQAILKNKSNYSAKLRTRKKAVLLKSFFYGIFTLFKLKNMDFLFFTNTNKRKLIKSKYYDTLFDAWADRIGQEKVCFIEWANSGHLDKKDIYSKNIVSDLPFKFASYLCSIFVVLKMKEEHILLDICDKYNLNINVKRELKLKLGTIYFYKWLFSLIKPKAIFVLSSYSKVPIVIAAHLLRIKVVEPQHGYIGKNHQFYYKYANYSKLYFPDYLLSFGDHEKRMSYDNFVFNEEDILPIGSYYLENIKNNFESQELSNLRKSFNKVFCVTLQSIHEDELLKWVKREAKLHSDWVFILRSKYSVNGYDKYLSIDNIVMLNQYNIYHILKYSDINITIFSTTAIEADFFNVKTFFFNIEGLSEKYFDIKKMFACKFELGQSISERDFLSENRKNSYFRDDYDGNVNSTNLEMII